MCRTAALRAVFSQRLLAPTALWKRAGLTLGQSVQRYENLGHDAINGHYGAAYMGPE